MEAPVLRGEKKVLLIVLDGLADRRTDKPTPLEAAHKPVMDEMARKGSCGIHYPLKPGVPIGSGLAHTLLFGYEEREYPGRGVLEAFGAGLSLGPNDLAFRINFATVDENYVVLDRRAGRRGEFIPQMAEELEEVLNNNPFGVKVVLRAYEGYRGVLVLSGDVLTPIPDIDPQIEGRPVRFSQDETTGRIVNWIVIHAYEFLRDHPLNEKRKDMGLPPANIILPRGAGKVKERTPFTERYGLRALAVADRNLYLGAAKYFGMDISRVSDEEKVEFVLERWHDYDFFFIHFKLTDVYGHDGRWEEKKTYIEKVDSLLAPLLERDAVVAVTGDHATPTTLKNHSGDPVPLLLYGGDRDDVEAFDEYRCAKGRLGTVTARDVMAILLNGAGMLGEVGK